MEAGATEALLRARPPGHECPSCGGLWVRRRQWTEFVADAERQARGPVEPLAAAKPVAGRPDSIESRGCPECGRYMARQNFARLSGIRVDVCYHHGVWLDAGELRAVRAFIVRGGLRLSRALAEDRPRDAFRRWEDLWAEDESPG
jgi:Zn-finger nucleic acid-binding protein